MNTTGSPQLILEPPRGGLGRPPKTKTLPWTDGLALDATFLAWALNDYAGFVFDSSGREPPRGGRQSPPKSDYGAMLAAELRLLAESVASQRITFEQACQSVPPSWIQTSIEHLMDTLRKEAEIATDDDVVAENSNDIADLGGLLLHAKEAARCGY